MITFEVISKSNYLCTLDLDKLYISRDQLQAFDYKWEEFYLSDETNQYVLQRYGNRIMYPHKSWIPTKDNGKPSVLLLGGNPAPHSVWKDVYYAYEGRGIEHRFWKVLRELGFIDLYGTDSEVKHKFLTLDYTSPFRLGFEAIFTFPSSASKPKWSGVMGLEKLFGKKYLYQLYEFEKERVKNSIRSFLKNRGVIIAMQKDAYNAISDNVYDIQRAVEGQLIGEFEGIKVIGTPPTRWLHTKKMKQVLRDIKSAI